jgi:hypothetical protein
LYAASICNTIGTNAWEETALTRIDNALTGHAKVKVISEKHNKKSYEKSYKIS